MAGPGLLPAAKGTSASSLKRQTKTKISFENGVLSELNINDEELATDADHGHVKEFFGMCAI